MKIQGSNDQNSARPNSVWIAIVLLFLVSVLCFAISLLMSRSVSSADRYSPGNEIRAYIAVLAIAGMCCVISAWFVYRGEKDGRRFAQAALGILVCIYAYSFAQHFLTVGTLNNVGFVFLAFIFAPKGIMLLTSIVLLSFGTRIKQYFGELPPDEEPTTEVPPPPPSFEH